MTTATPRPSPLPVIPENVPAELTVLASWVLWQYAERDGKLTKIPHTLAGAPASSVDPATWATFEQTVAVYRQGGWAGIGLVHLHSDNLTAGDADHCRDRSTGAVGGDAAAALLELDTYTEVSPSGEGLRSYAWGKKPGRNCKKGDFELYDGLTREGKQGGRFLTVTGHRLPGTPDTIRERQEAIERVYYRYWPKSEKSRAADESPPAAQEADAEILNRGFADPANGAAVRALYDGVITGYPSQSEADLALCVHLARLFGPDPTVIDRVFRTSKLYRDKWDRADYRDGTIEKAISPGTGKGSKGKKNRPKEKKFAAGAVNDAPDNPHRLAAGFLDDRRTGRLRYYRGEVHKYDGGSYRVVPDDDMRARLTAWVRSEFVRLNQIELKGWAKSEKEDKGEPPRVRPVTSRLVGDVVQAVRGQCLLTSRVEAPAWLDGATGPDPATLLPVRNGILDLAAAADRRPGCLLPPTPSFFTPTASPFGFDSAAPQPVEWLKFLAGLWPDDPESVESLRDWFGYLISPDTRQQKILFLVGPKRGGKGTIARVLRELVGAANVAGPTLGSLATNFGLSPLLGKSVAIVSDARLTGRTDTAVIVERLLSISGEDALTIDRKHRDPITVKLPTRFVILSNELPRLGDASGALAGRLILLRLTQSFYGREDHHLLERLTPELPGILLWALDGWKRLRTRGRFVQPANGVGLRQDMEDLTSPVGAFIRERCRLGTGFRVEVSDLYREWRGWCDTHGRREPGTEEIFGRDLRAAAPSVERIRPRTPEGRLYVYAGIRLRTDSDPYPDDSPAPDPGGPGGPSDQALHAWRVREDPQRESPHRAVVDAMGGRWDHRDHPGRIAQPQGPIAPTEANHDTLTVVASSDPSTIGGKWIGNKFYPPGVDCPT